MGRKIALRTDYTAEQLRTLSNSCSNSHQTRRLLALAAIYDGMTRTDAARIGGMDIQTLRDWVIRFNEAGLDGLKNRAAPGRRRRLSEAQMAELSTLVARGPPHKEQGLTRWRCVDLKHEIEARFGVHYHERTISKLLHALGFSHISGRPQHPHQNEATMDAFKKTSPAP